LRFQDSSKRPELLLPSYRADFGVSKLDLFPHGATAKPISQWPFFFAVAAAAATSGGDDGFRRSPLRRRPLVGMTVFGGRRCGGDLWWG
jgi:hypothetical protein